MNLIPGHVFSSTPPASEESLMTSELTLFLFFSYVMLLIKVTKVF